MTFYRLESVAHFGAAPDGATIIDLEDAAPFRGLALHADALTEVLRIRAARLNGGRGANLSGAKLTGADLREADLRWADLSWADLRGADLSGAKLTEADLRRADLRGADLRGANLRWADLRGADLRGADLSGADLSGANLRRADLRGADGIASPEEEAANIAAAVAAIAAEPENWRQDVWHCGGFSPATAPTVGSCGTAHCLAGWMQALLPIGHPLREVDPESAGWALAPRAASAGWFASETHPDLQARVDAAIAT